jgi:hypothetical protein
MDSDETKNELLNWIDCNIYGLNYCEERVKLISLISEVFERIPSEDRKVLMFMRGVRFIAPITNNSITEQVFIDPISDKNKKSTLCRCSKCFEPHFTPKNGSYDMTVGVWLVCLSSDIMKRPKGVALYTIANELAHVYLEIPNIESSIEEFMERENEIDKQIIKWGFESELRQTKKNYMYEEKSRSNEFSVDANSQ